MPEFRKVKLVTSNHTKKEKTVRRLKFQKKRIFYFLIILSLGALLLFILKQDYFRLKKITVNPKNLSCASEQEIIQNSHFLNTPFFLVNTLEAETILRKRFPCIEKIKVIKKLPDLAEINIDQRVAIAVVNQVPIKLRQIDLSLIEATPSSQEAKLDFSINEASVSNKFIVDKTGFIFSKLGGEKQNLPEIYFIEENMDIGKFVTNTVFTNILSILDKLKEFEIPIKSVKIEDNKLLIDAEVKIAFSLKKDYARQLASLQLILQKAKIESKLIDMIDLRFDKPIIIYSPNAKK